MKDKKSRDDLKLSIRSYIYAIVSVLSFISVSVGTTYAFWLSGVVGNDTNGEVGMQAVSEIMTTFYAENDINADSVEPGWSQELVFTIANVSQVENAIGDYTLYWYVDKNTINDESFVYTLSSTSFRGDVNVPISDTNRVVTIPGELIVPSASSSIGTGTINTGVTHRYTLTVKFLDNGENQNNLQGKVFEGKIIAKGSPNL